MKISILKLTDGKAGHITTTDGVIEAIKRDYDVEIFELQIKLRAKILLQILKLLIKYAWFDHFLHSNHNFLKLFYKDFQFPSQKIDMIVSTGGDTSFLNIWLSRLLKVKNIYCSQLRGLNPIFFHLIISRTDLGLENSIFMEVAPSNVAKNNILSLVEEFSREHKISKDKKYFVLMLGGDGAGYKFKKKDLSEIIKGFMQQVRQHGAKALITTSRRTGLENEQYLMGQLKAYENDIAYAVYFNHKPEKVVAPFLYMASVVFVTQESGSMIGESLYYKKPLFTLVPESVKMQKKYGKFLEDLKNRKRLYGISVKELENLDIDAYGFEYIQKSPINDLSDKIKPYLEEGLL
jgi:mitochondrial fission protein ELM1